MDGMEVFYIEQYYYKSHQRLFAEVIRQAEQDACLYENPRDIDLLTKSVIENRSKRYPGKNLKEVKAIRQKLARRLTRVKRNRLTSIKRRRRLEALSFEARQFLREKNKLFHAYCNVLGLSPRKTEKIIWYRINLIDSGKQETKSIKRENKKRKKLSEKRKTS